MLERACILALGKLGAAELNYSSDIDLVAVYDDRDLSRTAGGALGQQVSTLARGLREGAFRAFRRGCRLPGRLAAAPLRQLR